MLYPFSALLARMKYITRWSLMHSTRPLSRAADPSAGERRFFCGAERAILSLVWVWTLGKIHSRPLAGRRKEAP